MNAAQIRDAIDAQWNKSPHFKMDWMGLETILASILVLDEPDGMKVRLAKDALDAWTRRGHFRIAAEVA